jgi:hypothetical protein|tara:strand:+ start:1161 stop:1346 length:186 start_codon:yes stop_codon:yes gene_type:complete
MAIKVKQFNIKAKVNEGNQSNSKDEVENGGDESDYKIDEEALTINIYERVIRYLEREKSRF